LICDQIGINVRKPKYCSCVERNRIWDISQFDYIIYLVMVISLNLR